MTAAAAAARLAGGRCWRMLQLAGTPSLTAQRPLERQQAAVAQGCCRETKVVLMGDPDAAQGSAGVI